MEAGRNWRRGISSWSILAIFLSCPLYGQQDKQDVSAPGSNSRRDFAFREVGQEAGLFPHVGDLRAHFAAWGDVDGDGWLDLYVGTFSKRVSKGNIFLRNINSKFKLDEQEQMRVVGRASGGIFADLDNDGDLDFYLSNNVTTRPNAEEPEKTTNKLFRNDGDGKFTDISKQSNACPEAPPDKLDGRSVTVLDIDGDGLLDILAGNVGLFRNKGNLKFENVAESVGFPEGFNGKAVATGDFNNDGWPDIVLQMAKKRLFLNDGKGKFYVPPTAEVLIPGAAGVSVGDVNRDGLLDIISGHHPDKPWENSQPIHLYLNRGMKDGYPVFEEVTEAAGLEPLWMKAPHVEIQDLDNDGWPDIYVAMVKFADGEPYPLIYKNLGLKNGLPHFREEMLAINDFPTEEDKRAVKKSEDYVDKAVVDKRLIYFAAAPSGDYDNDGRIDLFMGNWWADSPSLLLHNETPGGNWIRVEVEGGEGMNRMGIGARVQVYPAGKLGDASALLGRRDIGAGYGYCSGHQAAAHFGLGKEQAVDLEIILPYGKGRQVRQHVKANQQVTVKF